MQPQSGVGKVHRVTPARDAAVRGRLFQEFGLQVLCAAGFRLSIFCLRDVARVFVRERAFPTTP